MDSLISRQEAIDAIERHLVGVLGQTKYDEGIAYGYETAHRHLQDVINKLPSAQSKTSCDGCKHNGMWENEFENGFNSPCTRCTRRMKDNYEQ